jgi:hypothetical protein
LDDRIIHQHSCEATERSGRIIRQFRLLLLCRKHDWKTVPLGR